MLNSMQLAIEALEAKKKEIIENSKRLEAQAAASRELAQKYLIQKEVYNALAEEKRKENARLRAQLATYSSSSRSSYTPTYTSPSFSSQSSSKAAPSYTDSMKLVNDLASGLLPKNSKLTFMVNLSYYMGIGKCYLPDILKGAIDGNNVEFVTLLINESSKLQHVNILELCESFKKLSGTKGLDPEDYAHSTNRLVIEHLLHQAYSARKASMRF